MAPLVDAVARCGTLLALDARRNGLSPAFARTRLLPAVRGSASLVQLTLRDDGDRGALPELAEAEELIRERRAAAAAAGGGR